jgi:hypothetical protein
MTTYSCTQCTKSFLTPRALQGHTRVHGPSGGLSTRTLLLCSCVITRREVQVKHLTRHLNSLLGCPECNSVFKPDGKQKYCSHSCSAAATNRARGPITPPLDKQLPCSGCGDLVTTSGYSTTAICQFCRDPIRPGMRAPIFTTYQVGAASKLTDCKCINCGSMFLSKRKSTVCCQCSQLSAYGRTKYARKNRQIYSFKFVCSDFPELFDKALLDEIASIGWYSPARKVHRNLTGLTKDHKISVADAVKHNHNPYYITHPLNCELIRQSENSSKKTKSTITYAELVAAVDQFVAK